MANPRRRHSKARGRRRRTHWFLKTPVLVKCPQCGVGKLPHRLCEACGYYDGRLIMDVESKKAKKEEKKKKRKG